MRSPSRVPSAAFAVTAASFMVLAAAGCAATSASTDASEDAVRGGTPSTKWPAAGFLVHGKTAAALDTSRAACGATLVAPNVVLTAAHCVLAAKDDAWAFGTGDVGAHPLIAATGIHAHPEFHAAPEDALDVHYYLRNNDLAYLVLASNAAVPPAALPDEAPRMGCDYAAIGYRATGSKVERLRAPACVEFRIALGDDPIFEVHPTSWSALCHGDGDEGGGLMATEAGKQVLIGVYVGSVTGGLTDCKRGTQFVDGYESAYGFRSFIAQAIADGARAR